MTCQALEAHHKGVEAVGQMQTAPLRLRIPVILTMHGKDKF